MTTCLSCVFPSMNCSYPGWRMSFGYRKFSQRRQRSLPSSLPLVHAMKRNIGESSVCAPLLKKKASVLHEVVRLLDEILDVELMHLQTLLAAKIQNVQTQKNNCHIVPVKTEKHLGDHGLGNHFISSLMKNGTEHKDTYGSMQFRQDFVKKINELQAAAFSVSNMEQKLAVSKKNNSNVHHPDYIALRVAQEELCAAKKRENAGSVWQLQDTLFVGRFLLTEMKWRMEKIAFQHGTTWCPRNDRIVSAVVNLHAELFDRLRQKALSQCKKLAKRCGGLFGLQNGFDSCSKFFEFCSSSFKFTEEETHEMKESAEFAEGGESWNEAMTEFETFSNMQMGCVTNI